MEIARLNPLPLAFWLIYVAIQLWRLFQWTRWHAVEWSRTRLRRRVDRFLASWRASRQASGDAERSPRQGVLRLRQRDAGEEIPPG